MAPSRHTCPVWIGHLLASPLRALFLNPGRLLAPYVAPGVRVLDVGCAMGFFSLPLARLVGPGGRVYCLDVQEGMLEGLARRARRAGLADRIERRLCGRESLGIPDLAGAIDMAIAFAVVHEVGDAARLFGEIAGALRPGGRVLFAEPKGHVSGRAFLESLEAAAAVGLRELAPLAIARSRAAILERAPEPP